MKAKFRLGETVKIVGNREGVIIHIHTGTLGNKYYDIRNINNRLGDPDYFFAVAESDLRKISKMSPRTNIHAIRFRQYDTKEKMKKGRVQRKKK